MCKVLYSVYEKQVISLALAVADGRLFHFVNFVDFLLRLAK